MSLVKWKARGFAALIGLQISTQRLWNNISLELEDSHLGWGPYLSIKGLWRNVKACTSRSNFADGIEDSDKLWWWRTEWNSTVICNQIVLVAWQDACNQIALALLRWYLSMAYEPHAGYSECVNKVYLLSGQLIPEQLVTKHLDICAEIWPFV